MKKWLLILGPALLLTAGHLARPALADRLESDSYVIQFGNFNVGSGEGDSSSYGLTYTIGQTAPGPFGEYGSSTYFVGSGFQYIYQIQTFAFSIDQVAIDLGELIIGSHSTASNKLTITTRGGYGWTIYAYEEAPLTHRNGTDTIPDTTCNAGGCDETTAAVWTTQTVPGFGFNVTSTDAESDFVDSTYFRQFADISNAETMQSIMSSNNIASNNSGTVTYKVGIDDQQQAGEYQTAVVYVAVPGY